MGQLFDNPGPNFKYRWSMMGIAAFTLVLGLVGFHLLLRDAFDDYMGFATRTDSGAWSLGATPRVTVDLPGGWDGDQQSSNGSILVIPSLDGQVRAELKIEVSTPPPRGDEAARLCLDQIGTDYQVGGETLRITMHRSPHFVGWRHIKSNLRLFVPDGTSLDLRTGQGSIRIVPRSDEVGDQDHSDAGRVVSFLAACAIKIRNDSPRKNDSKFEVIVRCRAPRSSDGSLMPTRLDIESPGKIWIDADLATIQATARHAEPDRSWENKISFPGSIVFEGALSGTTNSFRAAHQIDLKLSADASLRVDAEATQDRVVSRRFPTAVAVAEDSTRWWGAIGTDPTAAARLHTDNGPIFIHPLPEDDQAEKPMTSRPAGGRRAGGGR